MPARRIEAPHLPVCPEAGIAVMGHSVLAFSLLPGRIGHDRVFSGGDQRRDGPRFSAATLARVARLMQALRPIAEGHGASPAQIAIVWTPAQAGPTHALVGARSPAQAGWNAAAGWLRLTAREIGAISAAVAAHLDPPAAPSRAASPDAPCPATAPPGLTVSPRTAASTVSSRRSRWHRRLPRPRAPGPARATGRQAAEMGADIIEADPTDHPADLYRVVEAARVPVPMRGGGKKDLCMVPEKSAALVAEGARGLAGGRNVHRRANPRRRSRRRWRPSTPAPTERRPERSIPVALDLLLGIDVGNTVVKAVLFDLSGRQIARHGVDGTTLKRAPARVERPAEGLWSDARAAIAGCIAGVDPRRIAARGLTGHGEGLYLRDRAGAPRVGIRSLDSRAAAPAGAPDRAAGPELQATCGQRPRHAQTQALRARVRANRPDLHARAATLCLAGDTSAVRRPGHAMATSRTCRVPVCCGCRRRVTTRGSSRFTASRTRCRSCRRWCSRPTSRAGARPRPRPRPALLRHAGGRGRFRPPTPRGASCARRCAGPTAGW